MPGNCAIFRSWVTNDLLTASDLTTSFTRVGVSNDTPSCMASYAVDITQFRLFTDPYPGAVASLPTSLAGELERIRFVLRKVFGFSQWYTHTEPVTLPPGTNMTGLVTITAPSASVGALLVKGFAAQTADIFAAQTSTGAPILTAAANSRVGVGVTIPLAQLDVQGGGLRVGGAFGSAGIAANQGGFDQQGGGGFRFISYGPDNATKGRITLQQASANNSLFQDAMVFDSAGNVTFAVAGAITSSYGGTGQNFSASSGIPSINSGTWVANNVLTTNRLLYAAASNTIASSSALTYNGTTMILTGGGLQIGSPTGGDKGAGTVNVATDYFKNGISTTPTLTQKTGSGVGNYTTTSATYVDVDATNLSFTVTIPTGSKISVFADAVISNSGANTITVAILDGTIQSETLIDAPSGSKRAQVLVTKVIVGDGASHTIKMQWKTAAGTATMENGSVSLSPNLTFIMAPST